jgi:hypothetical protein
MSFTPHNKIITIEDEKIIVSEYLKGKTAKKILDILNQKVKTTKTVYDILDKYKVKTRDTSYYNKVDHFYFSNIDTNHKAYILGLMATDGYIVEVKGTNRKQVGIQLSEKDKHLIYFIKEQWKSDNKVLLCKKKDFYGDNGNLYHSADMYRIVVDSRQMAKDLESLGVTPRKSFTITLPIVDKIFQSHVIRGILDGNGTTYIHSNGINRCIRFLGSHYIIAQIAIFLHIELGIPITFPHAKPDVNISFLDYSTQDVVSIISKYLYKDLENSMFLERKFNVIKDYIN